jgi:rRNA maturation protein Nop10
MAIKAACQCGQSFNARDELAGKTVKCPKCGGALKIPAPAKPANEGLIGLLDEAGMKEDAHKCPACGVELAPEAILCVHCGFDLRKGQRLKSRVGSVSELDEDEFAALPTHGVPLLDHAERELARDKRELARLDKGVPWWMVFLALLGLLGFAIGMVMMPQDRVMETSAYVLIGAGGLLAAFFTLRFVITAFQESPLQGILNLLVPPYILYYLVTRWEKVGGLLIFWAAGAAMVGGGFLLRYFAPMMAGGGE